jgi:hypothetical protein
VEANALRRLKHELHALAEVHDTGEITGRLLAMLSEAGPAGPVPARHPRRGRYVLWSAVSLVVVGIGTAAFGMGGGSSPAGPQITPQLEVFNIQHAITSGVVLFAGPADVRARVPVGAATP